MIHLSSYEDIFDVMYENIMDGEESVSYVSDEEGIRQLMRVIAANSDIMPDLIEFNTEEPGYYYLSIDSSEIDDISYSIIEAIDKYGDFYGLQGLVLVDELIPKSYEKDVAENKYITRTPIRVSLKDECDGDCEHCTMHTDENIKLLTDEDDNVYGFHKEWSTKDSDYSFTFKSTNDDEIYRMLKLFD